MAWKPVVAVLIWILFGFVAVTFAIFPMSFWTPFIGHFYGIAWLAVGLVMVFFVLLYSFAPSMKGRTRAALTLVILSTPGVLFLAFESLGILGQHLWFDANRWHWSKTVELIVASEGRSNPKRWEYERSRGGHWIGIRYGAGVIDNWAGFVYSSTGQAPGKYPQLLFQYSLTGCRPLGQRWYFCGFT